MKVSKSVILFSMFCLSVGFTKDCFIIIPSGLNSIKIGFSKFEDVQREFGSGVVSKKWVRAKEIEICGHFEYSLYIQNLDVTFFTSYPNKHIKVVKSILFGRQSKCKTVLGNGIGSTFKSIKDEFGEPLYTEEEVDENSKHDIFETNYDKFCFRFENSLSDTSKVVQIILR